MSAPDPKSAPGGSRIESLMNQPREHSPQSSTEQEQSGSQKSDAAAPQLKAQPAVDADAKLDKIEALPSPDSSKQTPQPDGDSPPSFFSSLKSMTVSCRDVTKDGCGPKGWVLIILGAVIQFVTLVFRSTLVELHITAWSVVGWGIIVCSKSIRGKWAKQPPIQIAENKRNPYRDAPSLNEDDPMEPACPRPQQESPKEQVYKVDVHNPDLPAALSSPSTSTAVKSGDTKGACSGPPPSIPSTSRVVVPVNVHGTSRETAHKEESSEKDSQTGSSK